MHFTRKLEVKGMEEKGEKKREKGGEEEGQGRGGGRTGEERRRGGSGGSKDRPGAVWHLKSEMMRSPRRF